MSFNILIEETKKLLVNATPQRKFQLNKRLELIENLKTRASKINGAEEIEKLILKKDKTGRPFFSEYLEKLDLLEDLQNKKYLNPKTNKPFTPKEWLGSTASYRSKFRDPESFLQKKKEYQKEYMAKKKKDPIYKKKFLKKKKEEYFKVVDKKYKVDKGAGKAVLQLQDNKLLAYLLTAANKQKKNLKGTNKIPQFVEITKEGKFAGVKDNKTGITYHHARYKGPLGPNDKLITDHPQFNRVKDLTKIADRFKRSMPNETIASYFAKYERVPTNAELYNFLSKDIDLVSKYSAQAMSRNPLELHHRLGVDVAPDKSLQLTPQVRNNTAGVIVEEFKKGNISKDEATKQLKKVNVRVKLPGTRDYVGAKDIAPTQSVGVAKREISKMFLERVKEDPSIVQKMANIFKIKPSAFLKGGKLVIPAIVMSQLLKGSPVEAAEVKQPEVGTPIKYDSNVGAIVNENTDQPATQNQILTYIKDNPLKVTAGTSLAFAAEEIPGAFKEARKLGRGKVRSALGITGALKPVLTTIGTPAMTALFEAPFAVKRLEEGETATEILTDPLGPALGVAFMEPFSRGAGIIRGAPKRTMAEGLRNYFNLSNVGQARPGVTSKVLRLGMSPRMIAGASRFLGLPGLLLGAGLSGYDAYKNYQNQEGFLYNLLNKDE